ncbi:hypothetical protein, partial [Nocardia gipuzkoensis]
MMKPVRQCAAATSKCRDDAGSVNETAVTPSVHRTVPPCSSIRFEVASDMRVSVDYRIDLQPAGSTGYPQRTPRRRPEITATPDSATTTSRALITSTPGFERSETEHAPFAARLASERPPRPR